VPFESFVTPGARDMSRRARHLPLGQRDVAAAPDTHGWCLHRREFEWRCNVGLGWNVGPVPVQSGCQRLVGFELGDDRGGIGMMTPIAEVGPVVVGKPVHDFSCCTKPSDRNVDG
jgi:hypothetical protein